MRCEALTCRRMTRIAGVGEVHLHVAEDRKSWASVLVRRPFVLGRWVLGSYNLNEIYAFGNAKAARTAFAACVARLVQINVEAVV